MSPAPYVGQVVHYRTRGAPSRIVPALIVALHGEGDRADLTVFLLGRIEYAPAALQGRTPGCWTEIPDD